METNSASDEFTILKRDISDDSMYPVGRAALGPRGVLTIVSAAPGLEGPLQTILKTINGMEEFRIKVPAPPGSESYGLHARTVNRDSPDIAAALRDFLEQKYGLTLSQIAGPTEEVPVQAADEVAHEPIVADLPQG